MGFDSPRNLDPQDVTLQLPSLFLLGFIWLFNVSFGFSW